MTTITITTYSEVAKFFDAFGKNHLNMLIVCSRGGLGKSEEARRTLSDGNTVYIGGHVTPLRLYRLLHDGRDRRVYFDEIDGLFSDPKHRGLLKQLCETRDRKRIMYGSTDPRAAEIDGGAGYFYTRSHVLMLCNSFSALSANVAALKTRAMVVSFAPSSDEVMAKIKTFATDSEIVAFLEQFHHSIQDFSLRTYRILEDLKSAALDWQRYALQQSDVHPKIVEIADLLVRHNTDKERLQHHSGSRRDYYNWKPEAQEYLNRLNLAGLRGAILEATPQPAVR